MRHTTHSCRAFSLIELLVVVAIVVIVIGLLLPAVQKIRAGATRTQCCNHLKSMGLACHAYQDLFSILPSGGTNASGASSADPNDRSEWSWAYRLLPYLDQQNLYNHTSSNTIGAIPVNSFYCPARRAPKTYAGSARIDYAGNAGGTTGDGTSGTIIQTGHGTLRMSQIKDGAAYTLLIGEKRLNVARLGSNNDDNEPYHRPGWNGDYDVYRLGRTPPAPDVYDSASTAASEKFGSSHPHGVNVVFADGSVREVTYTVNATVFRHLCEAHDGQAVNLNDL